MEQPDSWVFRTVRAVLGPDYAGSISSVDVAPLTGPGLPVIPLPKDLLEPPRELIMPHIGRLRALEPPFDHGFFSE